MPVIASISAAVIPMTAYLFLLWKLDKYDKEPLGNIIKHFLWGAVGSILLAVAGSLLFSSVIRSLFQLTDYSASLWEAILIAPLVEEFMKGIFPMITVRSKNFDNLTDGLVYGGAIGLGFGMTENFFYFFAFGVDIQTWIGLVVIRSIFSAVMHCISTGSFGAMLAIAKFNHTSLKIFLPVLGYFIAVIIHFLWNLSVSFPATYFFGLLFMLSAIIFFIVVFYLSLAYERWIIREELEDETEVSLIPSENSAFLYSEKSSSKRWIESGLRKRYTRNIVKLALRKHQVKNSRGRLLTYYLEDIEKTREKLSEIVTLIRQDYRAE